MSSKICPKPGFAVKRLATLAVLLAGSVQLSACVGGTTYGTDKSQEVQTLDSVYNLFAITPPKQAPIDYRARPDLVIPENKQDLPQPLEADATTQNPAWPESPEQKRARLRAKADSNTDPIFQAATDDDGTPLIGIEKRSAEDNYRCLDKVCPEQINPELARKRALAAKAETKYSSVGAQRKFLTEPPNLYRTHSGNTAEDDLGLSEEELKRREEEAKAAERATQEHGGS